MDISVYIQDLLWDYECVIIPSFGGILATYRPAILELAEHRIYPPSKALAFNEYLTHNDGLLINYICQKSKYSYAEAITQVADWVLQTKLLLKTNEEIYLPSIGKFYRDVERNLQFTADTTVNYLDTAYGLPSVAAMPILRHSETPTEVIAPHRTSYTLPQANKQWSMAAVVLLFLAIGAVLNMLYRGVNIQPLNLNSASVLSYVEHWDRTEETTLTPVISTLNHTPKFITVPKPPVAIADTQATATVAENTKETVVETPITNAVPAPIAAIPSSSGKKYYIMVGAYQKPENLERAQQLLQNRFPDAQRYEDTSPAMVRIGFYAADSYHAAYAKLQEARKDDITYWLLVK